MIDTTKLRRLVQAALAAPDGLSAEWMDRLGQFQEAADASVVSELLDRLEAAESECLEQARLNGMGSEREAALMAKLEAAEKDLAHVKEVAFPRKAEAVAAGWKGKCERLEKERDALQAKVEAMEKQEPVGKFIQHPSHGMWEQDGYSDNPDAKPLYLAPGAQPAPSIPEGWKLVPIEPTHEMLDAGEDTFVPTYTGTPVSAPIDVYRAMLTAAPEAKP